MPAVDFTVRYLQGLKPQNKPFDAFDKKVTGFGVRVSPGGKKTFFSRYRNAQGRVRKIMLGPMTDISLADARGRAREIVVSVQKGADPQAERKQERIAETFGEVAELFVAHSKENNRPSTAGEDERYIRKELLATFGRWKLKDIRRRDIIALLEKVKSRKRGEKHGAPVAANRLQQVISRLFEFAVNRELVDSNPVYRLRKLTREKPRNRNLSDAEIKKFLIALDADKDRLVSMALRLTLMLARRRSEIFAWRWDEIENGIWTIPAERS